MARRNSPKRKMNPVFYIFCEGESEETYVNFLKQEYRLPIKIKSKVSGADISPSYLKNFFKRIGKEKEDKTFLMYDLDVTEVNENLKKCKETILGSNPTIELWFLLHHINQTTHIDTSGALRALEKQPMFDRGTYKKGALTEPQKQILRNNIEDAIARAKDLTAANNPSSNLYVLHEELRKVKAEK